MTTRKMTVLDWDQCLTVAEATSPRYRAMIYLALDSGMRWSELVHDLRHTSVALAIAAGAHPKAIQVRMGHSSITVTLDRYGHLFPELDETIADAFNEGWRAPAPLPPWSPDAAGRADQIGGCPTKVALPCELRSPV